MKLAAFILLASAAALAGPASAGISLSKAIKMCKAEFAKQTPPLKAFVDHDDTAVSETHLLIAIKVRNADNRMEKMLCKIDKEGTSVEIKPR